MQKNYIIIFIIGFILGASLIGSTVGIIYHNISVKQNNQYAEDKRQRDLTIASLETTLSAANSIIDGYAKQTTINANAGLGIIGQLENEQSEIRLGLQSGGNSIQKGSIQK